MCSTAIKPERERTRARGEDICVNSLKAGSNVMGSIIVGGCDGWGRGWMNGYVR